MTAVNNHSQLDPGSIAVIREALAPFLRVDQIRHFADFLHPRLELVRSVAYPDGSRDWVAACPQVHLSFRAAQDGRILSTTLWDTAPSNQDLQRGRARDAINDRQLAGR